MSFIDIQEVTKSYSSHKALDKVSFGIPQGTIFGLLGPNGAGKTTLIRILNRILLPDSGRILFNGHSLCDHDVENIGYLPEERGLYKKMKVGEQLLYLSQLKGVDRMTATQRLRQWFTKFDIDAWWNRNVDELSKGMQQKVQFISTIIHEPDFLIFDEPFSGFDPVNTNQIKNEMLELKKKEATIILSTHNMTSVEEICDNIVLIDHSKKILEGSVSEVKQRFKKNIFKLELNSLSLDFAHDLPTDIEILNQEQKNNLTTLTIKIPATMKSNDLLSIIMKYADIQSFIEILPSMSEIFIESVK
ncbi:MAG: ATP-binding cassette domain-containing protein [Bacteroidales bacterium]|nr:ATP-binding cassette domain-containing protein [Bacteroidales bacterium]